MEGKWIWLPASFISMVCNPFLFAFCHDWEKIQAFNMFDTIYSCTEILSHIQCKWIIVLKTLPLVGHECIGTCAENFGTYSAVSTNEQLCQRFMHELRACRAVRYLEHSSGVTQLGNHLKLIGRDIVASGMRLSGTRYRQTG